jgi:S1-C subfamily serine protease
MGTETTQRRNIRRIALAVIALLLGYWAGARWGPRGPRDVQARPDLAQRSGSTALTDEENVNISIYRKASPAVANIVTRTVEYDFFYNAVPVEGAGSGFVIDTAGHILTNYHVVEGAQRIEVLLGDQKAQGRFVAKLLGADQRNDVALIQIDPQGRKLTALPLADSSSLLVGQKVLAIGNPFGFQSTLTTGVISALGRTVQTSQTTFIEDAIQTDAAINRGNSGGPLLDTHGEVIGINSAIYSPSGTAAGIGFAIPVNLARQIAQDLISEGRVRRAFLGVEVRPLFADLADYIKSPVQEGLLIERVTPGGPAAKIGLRGGGSAVMAGLQRIAVGGDVIVAIDGKPVASQLDLNLALNRRRPGDVLALTLYRGREKMEIQVTLGER